MHEGVAVEEAINDVCVADVDRQEHGAPRLWLNAYRLDDISFDHCVPGPLRLAYPGVLPVQMGVTGKRNEHLARTSIATRQGYPDAAGTEWERGGLAPQEVAGTAKAIAPEVPELSHEARDHAMKGKAHVEARSRDSRH